jgi:hypothetical protein
LRDGAPRLVNSDSNNPIQIALQEIYEGKIVAENLDLSAEEAALAQASPDEETSPLAGVDLAELTDADAAGISLPGAADITGEPIDESTPEIATDRLDAVLEMGLDTVAALEDAAGPDGTALDQAAVGDLDDATEIAEAAGIPEIDAALDTTEANAANPEAVPGAETVEGGESADTEAVEASEE